MMKTDFILSFLGLHCFPLSCGVEILDISVLVQKVYARYTKTHTSYKAQYKTWNGVLAWSH